MDNDLQKELESKENEGEVNQQSGRKRREEEKKISLSVVVYNSLYYVELEIFLAGGNSWMPIYGYLFHSSHIGCDAQPEVIVRKAHFMLIYQPL